MLFSKEYAIKYYEQNVKGDLKESTLLNFLQDIATLSAESLGFGPSFVFSNNYAWVVLKYHIEIFEEIRNTDTIILKTEPRGTSKLYAFRDFYIYTKDDRLVGKAISTWALIEMDSRKILPTQKVLANYMPAYEKRETDLQYNKIDIPLDFTRQKEFEVRFDDIDVNHHANNCNYIVWALETLPYDFRLKYSPKTIDIKYKKEISLGGTVISFVKQDEHDNLLSTTHILKDKSNNEELSIIKIEWT